jgi:hypothetical protein
MDVAVEVALIPNHLLMVMDVNAEIAAVNTLLDASADPVRLLDPFPLLKKGVFEARLSVVLRHREFMMESYLPQPDPVYIARDMDTPKLHFDVNIGNT